MAKEKLAAGRNTGDKEMQILNGGSFVNLDSAEKIGQLVFTAKQIAHTATETEGFVNDEANNRQIALDIWQGAEYMTREHEEAQVKNIFVKNFIEELRELKNANQISRESVSNHANATETEETNKPVNSVITADERDEFLGFVAPTETEERADSAVQNETSPVAAREETENHIEDFKIDSSEPETDVSGEAASDFQSEAVAADLPEKPPTEMESEISTESSSVNPPTIQTVEDSDARQTSTAAQTAVGAIALPEKEPYQFDKCTVTATIQLLPIEADATRRKIVLSVRTHDFAPQISVVETAKETTSAEILPALERAFETYRSNLPLKVMDKLKREKSGAKRQSTASKTSTNTVKDVASATAESSAQTKNANAESVAAALKPETSKTAAEVVGGAEVVAAKPAIVSNAKSVNSKAGKTNDAQGSLFNF